MVKHTQTIRREIAYELFECVWPFCIAEEFLSVFDHFVELAIKGLMQLVINITLLSKKLPYFKIKIKKKQMTFSNRNRFIKVTGQWTANWTSQHNFLKDFSKRFKSVNVKYTCYYYSLILNVKCCDE